MRKYEARVLAPGCGLFSTGISTVNRVRQFRLEADSTCFLSGRGWLSPAALLWRGLRGRVFWSRSEASNPANNRAVMCARGLTIAWRRHHRDYLVRGRALDTGENGGYLVAIRGSCRGAGVHVRRAGDRGGADLGEMSRASRGPVNIVSQRRIGRRIRAGGPRKPHGVLRKCG